MKKDLARRRSSFKYQISTAKILIFFVLAAIAISIFSEIQPQNTARLVQFANPAYTKFHAWLLSHRSKLQHEIQRIKFSGEESSEEMHYEFYSSLPNSAPLEIASVKNKDIMDLAEKNLPNAPSLILKPELLAEEFAKSLQKSSYVVQFGAFRSKANAERYKRELKFTGIAVKIIKTEDGDNIIYKIEEGPFAEHSLAKEMKMNLENRGIHAAIRKHEWT